MGKQNNNQMPLFGNISTLSVIDFSRINIFRRCPLEYKYRYSPRNTNFDPQSNEVVISRYLHSFAKYFFSLPKNKRELFNQNNLDEWIENKIQKSYRVNQIDINEIKSGCTNLLSARIRGIDVIALEYSFKNNIKDFLLTGRVDCIAKDSQGQILIDYKLDEKEFEYYLNEIDKYLQLIYYYFGTRDKLKLENIRFEYFFFSSGRSIQFRPNNYLLQKGLERIFCLYKEREIITETNPKINPFCDSCKVKEKKLCPLWTRGGNVKNS